MTGKIASLLIGAYSWFLALRIRIRIRLFVIEWRHCDGWSDRFDRFSNRVIGGRLWSDESTGQLLEAGCSDWPAWRWRGSGFGGELSALLEQGVHAGFG